jgi:hypothetical protein
MRALIAIVYIVVGVIVAATHHYFAHLGDIRTIASAVLAVVALAPGLVRRRPAPRHEGQGTLICPSFAERAP